MVWEIRHSYGGLAGSREVQVTNPPGNDGHPLAPPWRKGKGCLVKESFVALLQLELAGHLRPYPHEQRVSTKFEDEMKNHRIAEILA